MVRVFTNGLGDWGSIPGWVIPKAQKNYAFLLNTQHYKIRIKAKWSNPGKRVAPSLYLRVVAFEKEPLGCPQLWLANLLTYLWRSYDL